MYPSRKRILKRLGLILAVYSLALPPVFFNTFKLFSSQWHGAVSHFLVGSGTLLHQPSFSPGSLPGQIEDGRPSQSHLTIMIYQIKPKARDLSEPTMLMAHANTIIPVPLTNTAYWSM